MTLSRCWRVTSGPISDCGSRPGPTFSACTRGASFCTSLSATSPPATATEIAMQRSPPNRGRADERERGHVGVFQERVARDLVAVDHLEDAGRRAGLLIELGQQ